MVLVTAAVETLTPQISMILFTASKSPCWHAMSSGVLIWLSDMPVTTRSSRGGCWQLVAVLMCSSMATTSSKFHFIEVNVLEQSRGHEVGWKAMMRCMCQSGNLLSTLQNLIDLLCIFWKPCRLSNDNGILPYCGDDLALMDYDESHFKYKFTYWKDEKMVFNICKQAECQINWAHLLQISGKICGWIHEWCNTTWMRRYIWSATAG